MATRMFSPGTATHQSAASPQRLEKSEMAPSCFTATTATEWPRSSGMRAISPARTFGERASSSPAAVFMQVDGSVVIQPGGFL